MSVIAFHDDQWSSIVCLMDLHGSRDRSLQTIIDDPTFVPVEDARSTHLPAGCIPAGACQPCLIPGRSEWQPRHPSYHACTTAAAS